MQRASTAPHAATGPPGEAAVNEILDMHRHRHVGALRVPGAHRGGVEAAAGEVGQGEGVEVVAAVPAADRVGALVAGGLVLGVQ